MKRTVALCLLSAALAFAAGWVARPRPRPAAPAPTTLEEEASEIAARYGAMDDDVHRSELTDAEKEDRWVENRRRRQAEMRGAYARHGKELPEPGR